ncbi:hypothetical protein AVDCRST_MAG81-2679 [uncultured Synechococcales cyanobacterium]|uniref:Uncharacterized protein n=1 Tax=uncultured Synechococcales cyanobacterium TaxID=1936017 RepID=A0A6J4VGJ7_9CYAN|nr:hypothetical protein AVDCRST_MAG81-2679 [uncultured Synechococcales cyanobacterium]
MSRPNLVYQTTSTSSPNNFKLDLRASSFTKLRRGNGLGPFRVITLVSLDAILLSLAWLVAEAYGTPFFASPWSLQCSPFALLGILGIQIGLCAGQGLYQRGDNRHDYFGLIKALTLGHLLLVLVAFLYQPGYFVSRSTFSLAWLLSLSFTFAGRLSTDLARIGDRGDVGRSL